MSEYRKGKAKIEKIVLESQADKKQTLSIKYRVAAYCRVSTDTEEQQSSFEVQVKVYTELIRTKAEWELAGIYADEGFSGTNASGRPEFQRMIQDCEEGKIDLIITKSISRFARNTLECLTYVRRLQNIGVNLIFENNNIDTRVAFSEMLLTILAAFAQEESRSISENTKWGIRKRFEKGIVRWCNIYGYTRNEQGEYIIVPEQAQVIKTIFQLYEKGKSVTGIWKFLNEQQIQSPSGKETWARSMIQKILRNEKYAGDIMLQKFLTTDHISHRSVKNSCTEVPAYYIENHHTPIIERKTFERVQKILDMKGMGTAKGDNGGICIQYPFGQMLHCPYCGQPLYQKAFRMPKQPKRIQYWCCQMEGESCRGFSVRSQMAEQAVLYAYNHLKLGEVERKIRQSKGAKTSKGVKAREQAESLLEMKKQHPKLEQAEYYWLDEFISKIEFEVCKSDSDELSGANSDEQTRMDEKGIKTAGDKRLTVFWKAGMKTMVNLVNEHEMLH